jgi:hypothetical protein
MIQYEVEALNFMQGFTLNAVPPKPSEIVAGGIGRNFVSRDLLEATSLDIAIQVFCNCYIYHMFSFLNEFLVTVRLTENLADGSFHHCRVCK